uniref:Uncharacterized protein n=1 Tax=Tanacetum cinerariifolium TaxID=118510 RepID=A0A6L2JTE6_TANCI|nr:hypothetical protein [Tanacetum cinerariifolium]
MTESLNRQQTPPQQDQPESLGTPIPFDPAPQVDYSPDLINIKPNNKIALLYPDHANKDHFKVVSDFISKCCLREAFIRTPTQYNEYLSKIEATKSASFSKEATESQDGHSNKRNKSGTAKDTNLSQPQAFTLMIAGMHKEIQQATNSPASLGVTAFTAEVDLDIYDPKDLLSQKQVKNNEQEEVHAEPQDETEDTLVPQTPPSPKIIKIQELTNQVLILQCQKVQLTKLKILDALSSLLNKVTEALNSPSKTTPQPEGEQVKKDKGKKALSHKEADEEESASDYEIKEIKKQKCIKQNINVDVAKAEIKKGKDELIDLLGLEVVERMYKDKVKYDKYCHKMLNRRAPRKIINCDVLLRGKGQITLKVYMDDGSDEVIQNFKASELHLAEWRDVMQVCPNRSGARWTTIYSQIKTRLENLHKTKEELSTKKYKSLVKFDDHQARTVLKEPSLADPSLLDALLSTFIQCVAPMFSSRKEASSEYLRIKGGN